MNEYHKIKGIFNFDEKTHKPINNIVDYFKPMGNRERIFTEKIDGTNIRIMWDGYRVSFGGRTDNAQISTKLLNTLQDIFIEELFEQKFGESNVVLFGEGFGGKIQKGEYNYCKDESFILFDVMVGDIYLERDNVEDVANYFNIKCVPVILQGKLSHGIDYVLQKKKSDNQICKNVSEGLVGIPVGGYLDRLGKRIVVKIKQEHFIK